MFGYLIKCDSLQKNYMSCLSYNYPMNMEEPKVCQ
jgi:hypothetical protein